MPPLRTDLESVFRRLFDDDELILTDDMSAEDVDGWDSMAHINLIIAVEKRFNVKFAASEIAELGKRGQTVGSMIRMLETKTAGAAR